MASINDIGVGSVASAVSKALGLPFVRSAAIGDSFNDTTEITITMLATKEQMGEIGKYLAAGNQKPAGPPNVKFGFGNDSSKG